MSDDRWRRVEELYHAALGVSPEERAAFLERKADGDSELRREVESLLAQHKSKDSVLDRPAWDQPAWTDSRPNDQSVSRAEALLAPGAVLGPYRITGLLGEGGMGQVYRAHDSRLERSVAIKVLFPGQDVRRFEREARAVAALSHPNVVPIFDVGRESGVDYLVEELVEGESLRDILHRGPLAVARFRDLAVQIAEGLAAAHRAGIIHRDLKPGNIMVSRENCARILDFGLATSRRARSDDATLTLPHPGVVAGTAAYMSPEQVQGHKIDTRSDIFSYGALLYEMITGRRAFARETLTATLAAVLQNDPQPVGEIVGGVPHKLSQIIHQCLSKDPSHRFQSIDDVKLALDDLERDTNPSVAVRPQRSTPRRDRVWWYAIAGAASMLALAVIAPRLWRVTTAPLPSAPVPLTAYRGDETSPDFSPDATQVVFAWNGEQKGKSHIYVMLIGSEHHLQLTNVDGSDEYPAWSPDGRWIAFQRIDATGLHTMLVSPIGGPERKVGDKLCSGTLAWSRDSQSLVCSGLGNNLVLVRVEGGEVRPLTSVAPPQADTYPAISPDGEKLLFVHSTETFDRDLELLELNRDLSTRGPPRRITNQHASLSSGLTWSADGREAIWSSSKFGLGKFNLYRVPIFGSGPPQVLAFAGMAGFPRVANRRNRLVYSRFRNELHLWRADGHTVELHPISSTENERAARFSPDGKRIAFDSDRTGATEIWVANADGAQPVRLTGDGRHSSSADWSPDGRWLVFDAFSLDGRVTLWVVEANGGKPRQLTSGASSANVPTCSHDGKWVYFGGTRAGRVEVYRIPFEGGEPVQLTHHGGGDPEESADGKTVYYLKSGDLWQIPAAGGDERRVGIHVWGQAFQVASDGIYYVASTQQGLEIRVHDFTARTQRTLQALGSVEVQTHTKLAVSPDHRTFLFTAREGSGADVMLVENFH